MERLAQPEQKKRGVNDLGILPKPIPFGKYYLLEKINTGGMAEVFKAKAFGVEGFERILAVKRILPSIAEDEEFITMFIDEAKIAGQLNHANIAQIFDLGKVEADEEEGTAASYFIALEYVSGKDLRAIFDRAVKHGEKLSIAQVCYIIMKVCEGLDYAHNKRDAQGRELGIVHRDVSPQNVLLSHEGESKVIDFGIAKAHGKSSSTQVGILKGKFSYMSPEQVRGGKIDRRSDIFAVGIVLYELLTLERLFLGSSDFSTLEKIRKVEFSPPTLFNPHIPQELEDIVLKSLARDPADRYQSAHEMQDALQKFMFNQGLYYTNKDLASYMKSAFAAEISLEQKKLEYYRTLKKEDLDRANKRASKKKKRLSWDEDEGETNVFDRPNISRESKDDILADLDNIDLPEDGEVVYKEEEESGGNGAAALPMPRSQPHLEALNNLSAEQLSVLAQPQFPPQQKSGGGKGLLIAFLVVLLLAGGGVAAYFLLKGGAPGNGTVQFQIQPVDAIVTVEIDGEVVLSGQRPPVSIDLDTGKSYKYRIISEGFVTTEGQIRDFKGDSSVSVNLAPADKEGRRAVGTGFMLVTQPKDAQVVVDGVAMEGESPFVRTDLMPGKHIIVVSKEGYKNGQKEITISADEVAPLNMALEPSVVALKLTSDPEGATYSIKNTRTGETIKRSNTPDTIKELSVYGEFEIVVEHPDYKESTQKWVPTEGKIEDELIVKLDKKSGSSSSGSSRSGSSGSSSRSSSKDSGSSSKSSSKDSGSSSSSSSKDSGSSSKDSGSSAKDSGSSSKDSGSSSKDSGSDSKDSGKPAPPGIVMINSKPPAEIWIKGKNVGNTPKKLELKPGDYDVQLINKEKGLNVTKKVKVESGQIRKIVHR